MGMTGWIILGIIVVAALWLIMAYNGNREGVLNNYLQPEKKFRFRFDVGTTF